ncbi:MAG: NAD(P)-binding domain-containing protein [Sandaracinaceae bacterium]
MIAYVAITIAILALAALAVATVRRLESSKESAARAQLRDLEGMGEVVAGGRHPKIDPDRCIGSGACVAACPEKGVLAIVKGRGVLANPLACVGHGLCMDACPVEAIQLVYGSKNIAVALPKTDEHYETNVPGLFVIGEASGMGLIRNAIAHGRAASARISGGARRGAGDVVDALVVGGGPSGIAATLGLMEAGLRVQLLDREVLGGTILHYPRAKLVMTGTLDFPIYGKVRTSTMSKEELVALWNAIDEKVHLPFRPGELVDEVAQNEDGTFEVHSTSGWTKAANVVLALGRRGSPNKLGVPGEELSKVAYQLLEPREFAGKHTMVVGGGNSAVECAIALADEGTAASVSISYRRGDFARCRNENRERIRQLLDAGSVRPYLSTEITQITEGHVRLRGRDGRLEDVVNDGLIVQIGGTPPSQLLQRFGIQVVEKRGEA